MKRFLIIPLIALFCLTACSNSAIPKQQSPEETIQTAFSALKEQDFDTFNTYSNNKNNITYRLFNELSHKRSKKIHQQFAELLLNDFSWKIHSVQINGDTAIVKMTLSNKDFSESIGNYIIDLIKQINEEQSHGKNLAKSITQTVKQAQQSPEALLQYLEQCDESFSTDLDVHLKKTNSCWKIQLDDPLCNVITGNLGSNDLDEDIQNRISAAEALLNNNVEQ